MIGRRQWRERHAVEAHDFGCDPLTQTAGVLWIDQQVAFRMGMGVDETGGDGQTGGVNPQGGGCR